MLAAAGSQWAFHSADGVPLYGSMNRPNIICRDFNRPGTSGCRVNRLATFVIGPTASRTISFGWDRIVSARNSTASSLPNSVSCGQSGNTDDCGTSGCRVGPSTRSSAPGTMWMSFPAVLHIALASFARSTGCPETVVIPRSSARGCASRYASATASSMSDPISVSNRILTVSSPTHFSFCSMPALFSSNRSTASGAIWLPGDVGRERMRPPQRAPISRQGTTNRT